MITPPYDDIRKDPNLRAEHYKEMVSTFYDEVTAKFIELMGPSFHFAYYRGGETAEEATEHIEHSIVEDAKITPGMRVLDVGCGIGGPTLTIARKSGASVVGLNISNAQVAIARQRAAEAQLSDRVTFDVGDAMALPYPDASFDHVYSFEAAYHMPDKARFVLECARVLKPGGYFLGTDLMARDGLSAEDYQQYIEPLCRASSAPHMNTLGKMREQLEASGLQVEVVRSIAELGDMTHNWEFLDSCIEHFRNAKNLSPFLTQMSEKAVWLAKAGRAGAFLVGQWRARKP